MNKIVALLIAINLFSTVRVNAQHLPDIVPNTPSASGITDYSKQNYASPNNSVYRTMNVNQRNAMLRSEVDQQIDAQAQAEERARAIINDAMSSLPKRYRLPSKGNKTGADTYRSALAKLQHMSDRSFSIKKATFIVENAFFENKKNYAEFDKTIEQTGDFLRTKMQELGYDDSNNLAKNFLLFQFFSDTLAIESKQLKHLPLAYDFEDYMGKDDWTKMFVSKLLETGKGQCNSLPQLYLILAEEIGAEARLSLSPNHSYIKFQDDAKRKWYNVELTNGMLTTDAFILQSGYIKAEALQNKIFMHPLTDKQLLSQQLVNLGLGYIRKYSYDEMVPEIVGKALELNPHNVNAQLVKANYDTFKLQYALQELGISKENFSQIKHYPFAVELYHNVMNQYKQVDALGYQQMPEEAYQQWLHSVKGKQNKQYNKDLKSTIKTHISVKQ
ncbi:hypothetical protein ATE84_2902 [Aquimarina sp. MAR_2010_214]|uniref:hypothetical protein n=1 Tax=Aquimarina sp. MAR_2010_214 TaxID=1250026 RepID=UPI000C706FE4|nr:hypothetical protein [Aquimarina sp. MAR_2010_214]PKV50835.1 hypothetical protein ATE84_2902 [Aquimarina sp. MAR_2010_214]